MAEKASLASVGSPSRANPRRVVLVRPGLSPRVRQEAEPDDLVTTFPHLVVREIVAFEAMVIVLAVISLSFDAPLEWIANPDNTPNPAKAPWYFLGLQELLHYFPPVVAGVLIPALVVIALVIIPYFEINLLRRPLWAGSARGTLGGLSAGVAIVAAATAPSHAWPILAPTLVLYVMAVLPAAVEAASSRFSVFPRAGRFLTWLRGRSLAFWIMTWFVTVAFCLTTIGVFFRGPGWRWSWPWIEGIY